MNIKVENWNGHSIRFVEKESGCWWAVARDVAEALGYQLTTNMTRLLDQSDKDMHKVNTLGGEQDLLIISEFGIYDAVFNSHKPEAKEFKRWVFELLKTLRQASGLEGYRIFRMLDRDHQKEAMASLRNGLTQPARVDFIKANTVANKTVSNLFGYPKMIGKTEMTPDMLVKRQQILDDIVNLMTANESFGMRLSVSKIVYNKYTSA